MRREIQGLGNMNMNITIKTQEKNENWIGAMNMILYIITMIGGIIIDRPLF